MESNNHQRADIGELLENADTLELSTEARVRLECLLHYVTHGNNVSVTSRRFGISRTTLYNWLKKVDLQDPSSLENQSHAPRTVPQSETDERTITLIRDYRKQDVLLNKSKVSERLRIEHNITISASTVGRIINREGFYFADTPSHREKRAIAASKKSDTPMRRISDKTIGDVHVLLYRTRDSDSGMQKAAVIAIAITGASVLVYPTATHALEGSVYQLHPTFPNEGTDSELQGSTFTIQNGALTDTKNILIGSQYQTTFGNQQSSATASTANVGQSAGGTEEHSGGGRRTIPPSRFSSSSASLHSATNSQATSHSSLRSPPSNIGLPENILLPETPSPLAPGGMHMPQETTRHSDASVSSEAALSLSSLSSSAGACEKDQLYCMFQEEQSMHQAPRSISHQAASPRLSDSISFVAAVFATIFLSFIGGTVLSIYVWHKTEQSTRKRNAARKGLVKFLRRYVRNSVKVAGIVLFVTGTILALLWGIARVHAATTTPPNHWYQGRLLSSSGNPVTTAVSIRLSYWSSADFTSSDLTGTGSINTAASNYVSWYEEHTVTPGSDGSFAVELGSVRALPDLSALPAGTLTSLYLQVDVKASGAADSTYDLLDADTSSTTVDRTSVLSLPFARNADLLDRRDVGTGSGSIPLLSSGASLKLNGDLTINFDNDARDAVLTFGNSILTETIKFSQANERFEFSDDVYIQGNLTVTGSLTIGNFMAGTGTGAGTIRYTGSGFQGFNGSAWKNFDAISPHTIMPTLNTAAITTDDTNNQVNVYIGSQTGSTANPHQYYRVTSGSGTLQDIDIRLKILLPADFVSFANSGDLSFTYKNTGSSSAQSKLDILVEDNDGDDAFTASDGQGLFNTSWSTYSDEFDGASFNPAAVEYVYVTIKAYASSSGEAFSGEIILTYTSR